MDILLLLLSEFPSVDGYKFMLIPVILAGGVGSRLWPVSRSMLPKQFIEFPNMQGSPFQNTLSRLDGIDNLGDPYEKPTLFSRI